MILILLIFFLTSCNRKKWTMKRFIPCQLGYDVWLSITINGLCGWELPIYSQMLWKSLKKSKFTFSYCTSCLIHSEILAFVVFFIWIFATFQIFYYLIIMKYKQTSVALTKRFLCIHQIVIHVFEILQIHTRSLSLTEGIGKLRQKNIEQTMQH